jgi:single-strand DNA-binding protein
MHAQIGQTGSSNRTAEQEHDMNDTYLTISGNVVDEPKLRKTANGISVVNFRVGSTSRRMDSETGEWGDRDTLFVNVTCWRVLGLNVHDSLHKGQAVIVHGRFYGRQFIGKDEISRVSYEIDAISVGHDMARGTSQFSKTANQRAVTSVELDPDGVPAIAPDDRFDEAEVPRPAFAVTR